MRVTVLLQITGDDGTASVAEEVDAFEKPTERQEDLGLSISEGKAMMATVQHRTVNAQAAAWVLSALVPASIARSIKGEMFSDGLQHAQNRCGSAKEVEPAVIGGDPLTGLRARTEEAA